MALKSPELYEFFLLGAWILRVMLQEMHAFFEHLIHHIKKGTQICAGSMILGEPASEEYLISDTAQECIN